MSRDSVAVLRERLAEEYRHAGKGYAEVERRIAAYEAAIAALTREAAPQASGEDELPCTDSDNCRRCSEDADTPHSGIPRGTLATTDSAIQSQQGATGGAEWQHIANEWADAATNGLQWLRNVRDGVCLPEKGIAEMVENIARIRALVSELSRIYKEK